MEWLWVIAGVAGGFFVGRNVGRFGKRELTYGLEKTERNRLEAEHRYLEGLRRQLAMALLDEDPQALLDAHATAQDFIRAMRDGGKERIEAERRSLSLKFPSYIDFDHFGTRHFIPVDRGSEEVRVLVERYLDISKFMTVLEHDQMGDVAWKSAYLDKDRQVLERSVERWRDRITISRLKEAMGRYRAWGQHEAAVGAFEDRDFRVQRLANRYKPEIEYGIELKADGTNGIYSFYVHDGDAGRISHSYQIADGNWEGVRSLSDR
jgi:hypothetical protein